ncbi:hypothetical protein D9M72_460320 [compost metagenome]
MSLATWEEVSATPDNVPAALTICAKTFLMEAIMAAGCPARNQLAGTLDPPDDSHSALLVTVVPLAPLVRNGLPSPFWSSKPPYFAARYIWLRRCSSPTLPSPFSLTSMLNVVTRNSGISGRKP